MCAGADVRPGGKTRTANTFSEGVQAAREKQTNRKKEKDEIYVWRVLTFFRAYVILR